MRPRFFQRTPQRGKPLSTRGLADGLARMANALENLDCLGGYVDWNGDYPVIVTYGSSGVIPSENHEVYPFAVESRMNDTTPEVRCRGGNLVVVDAGGGLDIYSIASGDPSQWSSWITADEHIYLYCNITNATPTLDLRAADAWPAAADETLRIRIAVDTSTTPGTDDPVIMQLWRGGDIVVSQPLKRGEPASIGTTAAQGTSEYGARADHVHKAHWDKISNAADDVSIANSAGGKHFEVGPVVTDWFYITLRSTLNLNIDSGKLVLQSGCGIVVGATIASDGSYTGGATGVSGTFTDKDDNTITVQNGIVTGLS